MGARTYCQDIGRFLQPDPLFEAFARHTPYHYSFNSPLVWLDPSGLAPEKEKGEERMQAFLYPVIFEQMDQVYSYQIIILKSRITEMMIRSEILGILKTISDSYYGGDIPDNGNVDIGGARVAWSAGSENGNYRMDVSVSQGDIEVNYSERGTVGKNGQLNISSISVSTTNIDKADAAGWLSGVHKGIKGSVAKEEKPRYAKVGITIYGNRETGETLLDAVQMGLDVAGVIDPSGICDFGGACLSFVRGDYEGAVISAAGIFGLDFLKLGKVARFGDEASGITKLADEILEWLGEGAKPYKNNAGDPFFMSDDGLRKVRWDWNRTNPHDFKHLHFEIYQNGKWIDAVKGKKQIGKWK